MTVKRKDAKANCLTVSRSYCCRYYSNSDGFTKILPHESVRLLSELLSSCTNSFHCNLLNSGCIHSDSILVSTYMPCVFFGYNLSSSLARRRHRASDNHVFVMSGNPPASSESQRKLKKFSLVYRLNDTGEEVSFYICRGSCLLNLRSLAGPQASSIKLYKALYEFWDPIHS